MQVASDPSLKQRFGVFLAEVRRLKHRALFRASRRAHFAPSQAARLPVQGSLESLSRQLQKVHLRRSPRESAPGSLEPGEPAQALETIRKALTHSPAPARAALSKKLCGSGFLELAARLLETDSKCSGPALAELAWVCMVVLASVEPSLGRKALRQAGLVCLVHGLLDYPCAEVFANSAWLLGVVLSVEPGFKRVLAEFGCLGHVHCRVAEFEQSPGPSSALYQAYLAFVSEYFADGQAPRDPREVVVVLDKVADIYSDLKQACLDPLQPDLVLSLGRAVGLLEARWVESLLREPKMGGLLADLVERLGALRGEVQLMCVELLRLLSGVNSERFTNLFAGSAAQESLGRVLGEKKLQRPALGLLRNLAGREEFVSSVVRHRSLDLVARLARVLSANTAGADLRGRGLLLALSCEYFLRVDRPVLVESLRARPGKAPEHSRHRDRGVLTGRNPGLLVRAGESRARVCKAEEGTGSTAKGLGGGCRGESLWRVSARFR